MSHPAVAHIVFSTWAQCLSTHQHKQRLPSASQSWVRNWSAQRHLTTYLTGSFLIQFSIVLANNPIEGANRHQNTCHRARANAIFDNGRLWSFNVPSQCFTSVCLYLILMMKFLVQYVLTSSLGTMATNSQSPQAFMIRRLDYLRIVKQKFASISIVIIDHRYHTETAIPCTTASAYTILL